ncbi:FHA domain-containing protein [bacterium]|nr:FHA domain-containing protein [bacterium]
MMDVKLREARLEISPLEPHAVERVPLHDVAFERPLALAWPQFVAGCEHLIRACIDPDPRRRATAKTAREIFEKELAVRPSTSTTAGERPWRQILFQMRPLSNRLAGDAPRGGIRITETNGELAVEEAPPARSSAMSSKSISAYRDSDSMVQFRTSDHLAHTSAGSKGGTPSRGVPRKSNVPEAPKGLIYLADVLRELKAGRPLPVSAPALVTRTGFSPRELARCMIFSLDRAHGRLKVSDEGDAQAKKEVSVGRGEDQDLVLADGAVSKKHLVLERHPDKTWWVRDLASANGTTVDEEPVDPKKPMKLKGSLATIGVGPDSKLTFMDEEELGRYLRKALELWAQAFARGRRSASSTTKLPAPPIPDAVAWPPPTGSVPLRPDRTLPYAPNEGDPTPWLPTERTRRVERPHDIPKPAPEPTATGQIPADLEARLRSFEAPKTLFYVVLYGARVEIVETVEETLELVEEEGENVLAIEAKPAKEEKFIVYERGKREE